MCIVCSTDFSEDGFRAAVAGAQLAARLKVPLHVVYATQLERGGRADAERRARTKWSAAQLARLVEQLRAYATDVRGHLADGDLREAVHKLAARTGASLIVVPARGRLTSPELDLSPDADDITRGTRVPVLVVRTSAPFELWVGKVRSLRIALAVDDSVSAVGAAKFVRELSALGPCDVTALHVPAPKHRSTPRGELRPQVGTSDLELLESERRLRARLRDVQGDACWRIRTALHANSRVEGLCGLATDVRADVLVVGAGTRAPVEQLWQASLARRLLEQAPMSVLYVPAGKARAMKSTAAPRCVLAATDFSESGNAAVALAYQMVRAGGTVHLLHVLEPSAGSSASDGAAAEPFAVERAAQIRLRALAPTTDRAIKTELHVLFAADAADAICDASERLHVDALCLGTGEQAPVEQGALGPVAELVRGRTRRALLFARRTGATP